MLATDKLYEAAGRHAGYVRRLVMLVQDIHTATGQKLVVAGAAGNPCRLGARFNDVGEPEKFWLHTPPETQRAA